MVVRTECEHCFGTFEVEPAMRGAIVNCPECGKATMAAGEGDPLWVSVKALALLACVVLGVLVGASQGLAAGALAGFGAGGALWLLSQAL